MGEPFSRNDVDLYREHGPALVRFATGLVGPDDAADVVQTAVMRAFQSRAWTKVTNHRAYLFRSVANSARSMHRSAMRRRAREMRTATLDVDYQPEVRPEVLEAVGVLSPRQREVVYLTYWEDMNEATVARTLGIGAGSVRRHLGRGRDKLRSLLDE
jgi:RNA polymerase sigma-70 factor (ECF subfamily)